MVICPHADDPEIGCGGFIARTIAQGGIVTCELLIILGKQGD
jgi:LmbE family N-acetylglucosaminyl deacetylase